MGLFDSVTGFLDDYGPILKVGASAATGYMQNKAESDTRQQAINIYNNEQKKKYDDALALKNYNDEYAGQMQGVNAANSAARRAASAANAAAARATDANKNKALKKAQKIEDSGYTKALGLLSPIYQSGMAVLPEIQRNYTQALQTAGSLLPQVATPEAIKSMNTFIPASAVNLQLPDYMKARQ